MFTTPEFWIAVGQIILIDIVLGGDNAVVIALACRSLPPKQRLKGIMWGTAGAIVLRVILIFFALTLLRIPYLKLVGALLLLWIGVKLLLPEHGEGHSDIAASDKLWGAVKTVIVADFVMSLDNVIAIAGAAEAAGGDHTMSLVIFGLLVSIPIIVWGSQLVLKLMDRFPIVITLGAMLLGWIAGTMAVGDPALAAWVPTVTVDGKPEIPAMLQWSVGAAGAVLVLLLGRWFAARARVVPAPQARPEPRAVEKVRNMLVAVDGSQHSLQAVRRAVALRNELSEGSAVGLHLVNVQRPLSSDVTRFVAGKTVDDYHREQGEAAFAPARAELAALHASAHEQMLVGEPGPAISQAARDLGCDLIVMGARGLGGHTAVLLGSVTQETIEHAGVPVLVVK
jgi:YjbE family integral membrane protein